MQARAWSAVGRRFAATAAELFHPSMVPRVNRFAKPVPAWLRDVRSFSPLKLTQAEAKVFAMPVRLDILHRVVHWYRSIRRAGLASTKHRSDVRGSTRKIRQQKGTGRARAGSSRAPQRVGGARCFGPKVRSYYYSLSPRVRALGLRSAFSAKFAQGELSFVTDASFLELQKLALDMRAVINRISRKRVLLIDYGKASASFAKSLAACNCIYMDAAAQPLVLNAYHVLNCSFVVLTESAKRHFEKMLVDWPRAPLPVSKISEWQATCELKQ